MPGAELCQSISNFGTVRQWIRVQVRADRHARCGLYIPGCRIGNDGLLRRGLAQAQAFIRKEKERLVLYDRSAEHSTEIVLPLFRFLNRWIICVPVEPIVRVQHVIPEILEERAVKIVRSRSRHNRYLAAGSAPELRRE